MRRHPRPTDSGVQEQDCNLTMAAGSLTPFGTNPPPLRKMKSINPSGNANKNKSPKYAAPRLTDVNQYLKVPSAYNGASSVQSDRQSIGETSSRLLRTRLARIRSGNSKRDKSDRASTRTQDIHTQIQERLGKVDSISAFNDFSQAIKRPASKHSGQINPSPMNRTYKSKFANQEVVFNEKPSDSLKKALNQEGGISLSSSPDNSVSIIVPTRRATVHQGAHTSQVKRPHPIVSGRAEPFSHLSGQSASPYMLNRQPLDFSGESERGTKFQNPQSPKSNMSRKQTLVAKCSIGPGSASIVNPSPVSPQYQMRLAEDRDMSDIVESEVESCVSMGHSSQSSSITVKSSHSSPGEYLGKPIKNDFESEAKSSGKRDPSNCVKTRTVSDRQTSSVASEENLDHFSLEDSYPKKKMAARIDRRTRQESCDLELESPHDTKRLHQTKQRKQVQTPISMPAREKVEVQQSCLGPHIQKYEMYQQRMARLKDEDCMDEILQVKEYLAKNRVHCFKYNHALDTAVQNFTNFQAFLQLSSDGETLIITNRKPVENTQFVLEADPSIVQEHRQKEINRMRRPEEEVTADYCPTELDEDTDQIRFEEKRSSASCRLSDIQGFIYGGQSSRFWMLRKHINATPLSKQHTIPFYSWNCITLQMPHRDLDLVVRSDHHMKLLLKLLVYSLKTLDGQKNSASNLLGQLKKAEISRFLLEQGRTLISPSREHLIEQLSEYRVFSKVCRKYTLLTVRQKIAHQAFIKGMTIPELYFSTIQSSLEKFIHQGIIHMDPGRLLQQEEIMKSIKNNQVGQLKHIVYNNIQVGDVDEEQKNQVLELMEQDQDQDGEAETFVVKNKDGNSKTVKIDPKKNQAMMEEVNRIFSKDNTDDLFAGFMTQDPNQRLFEMKNVKRYLERKLLLQSRRVTLGMIRIFQTLQLLHGPLFLKCMLKKIEISKEVFLVNLEQGRETFIPFDLSQDHLPSSYRYYDSILHLIQTQMAADRKEFYGLKKAIAYTFHVNSFENVLKKKLGLTGEDEKLTFQHQAINQKRRKEINHHDTPFSQDLQRSRYIQIDNEIMDQKRFVSPSVASNNALAKSGGGFDPEQMVNEVSIKFCRADQVNKNRKAFLIFKGTFASKQSNIKNQGQKHTVMGRLENWIEENTDELMAKFEPSYEASLTSQQLRAYKRSNIYHRQEQVRCFLLKQASAMVAQRRYSVQIKKYSRIKEMITSREDFEQRQNKLDKLIEYDLKFFIPQARAGQLRFYDIIQAARKVENRIRMREAKA